MHSDSYVIDYSIGLQSLRVFARFINENSTTKFNVLMKPEDLDIGDFCSRNGNVGSKINYLGSLSKYALYKHLMASKYFVYTAMRPQGKVSLIFALILCAEINM